MKRFRIAATRNDPLAQRFRVDLSNRFGPFYCPAIPHPLYLLKDLDRGWSGLFEMPIDPEYLIQTYGSSLFDLTAPPFAMTEAAIPTATED